MTLSIPNLQSLVYSNEKGGPNLSVLDQLLVPNEKVYVDIADVEAAWSVIRSMQVRGAPLIAIVACLGLAVDLSTNLKTKSELDAISSDEAAILAYITKKMNYLRTSRPTAVNLFNALDELTQVMNKAAAQPSSSKTGSSEASNTAFSARERIVNSVVAHAEFMLHRDVSDNEAIGANGADAILAQMQNSEEDGVRILTICNTGSLATAGYGTALGVARALHSRNKLKSITALETRPYNQGSRLTAFEIVEEGMPGGTIICDSAAAALMRVKGVDACVVGADRICANGDTANKIGTYQLAIVAAAHEVPFYVAAPYTTIDINMKEGANIEIEERPAEEFLESSSAPKGIGVWNPAFDVTPAKFITGIITEKGIIRKEKNEVFDIPGFIKRHDGDAAIKITTKNSPCLASSEQYVEQSIESLPRYLASNALAAMEALGTAFADDLECLEMGDGNLNLVFIVTNTKQDNKKVIVKQALPYVRCVGESWPLTSDRASFEYAALLAEKAACPAFVPDVYFFSKTNSLIVMEYIPFPNIILRKGLIAGIRYPTMAHDMGVFCANTLFKTSGFKLSASELRKKVEFWTRNSELCALTELVVFTEPYIKASNNRWTSPQLNSYKQSIEANTSLKVAASKLKAKFVTETQALLHGDLHSGSVMCSPEPGKTFVIDPEFAFYGPMGFDLGALIANLLLSYVSQSGHVNTPEYTTWVLEQVIVFWNTFQTAFVKLWNDPTEHTGFKYPRSLFPDAHSVELIQEEFMKDLLKDTLGFAGMKMVRRIVGIAHVEDLESIQDSVVRATCEIRGLEIAIELIIHAGSYTSIEKVVSMSKEKNSSHTLE